MTNLQLHKMRGAVKRIAMIVSLALVGCAGLKLANPLRIDDADWPTFGKSSQRTNATSEIVAPPLALAWEHDITTGMGYGSPIVIDTTVIVSNMRGELYGISANTGKRIGWVTLGEAFHGSPVVDRNVAYVASANAKESVIAFDLLEGKTLWKQEYGDIEVTPLLFNERLYVGNTAGVFFCINKENGELEWKYRLRENTKHKGIRSSATVSGEVIMFGAEDGNIYALGAKYGTEQWSYNTGAPIAASPAVNNDVVFCGNSDGNFVALNVADGKRIWQFSCGASIYATASFANTLVLIGTTGGKLFALNSNDGTKVWSTEFNSVINSSAVVSGSVAYVGTLRKELAAVNIADGAVVWRDTLRGRIKTSPAVAHGKVFVATDDKMVLAFKPIEEK
jgi:outer membrane protein assembly factor BamB